MPKLFKLVCVGVVSVFIGILSSSIYAKKGGASGGSGKGSAMSSAGNSGKGHKHFNSKKKSSKSAGRGSDNSKSERNFSDKDREIINNFFSTHPFNTTGLPPGIAKNLARGKPLPPGVAKVFLPQDLINSLGAYPNYDYLVAGRDVLLVNKSDQIITDILYNILR
ncbi:MAG: hypothetical protein ACD_21C00319G0004 [uncultured bacterium]|nr:MAG: hypothetical protein ACD_21C00319G0004 [uncultured bacterium]